MISTSFHEFSIYVSSQLVTISSVEEMKKEVDELIKRVFLKHTRIVLEIPPWSKEEGRAQARQFLSSLDFFVTTITAGYRKDLFHLEPSKTVSHKEGLVKLAYLNGIMEEIRCSEGEGWEGTRKYPNGTIKTGKFWNFYWQEGMRVKEGETIYRLSLAANYEGPRRRFLYRDVFGLMYVEDAEGKRLISIKQKADSYKDGTYDYVQIDKDPVPVLAHLLLKGDEFHEALFKEMVLDVGKKQFMEYLVEQKIIFLLAPDRFKAVRGII